MAGIADQFKGLPMSDLISQPLIAAAQAQGQLSNITQQFIKDVGLEEDSSGGLSARSVDFGFNSPVTNAAGDTTLVSNKLSVPLLSIVNQLVKILVRLILRVVLVLLRNINHGGLQLNVL